MENQPSAVILAAGLSTRIGSPKFALKFKGQKTFLEEIVDRFAEFSCSEIIIVLNPKGKAFLENMEIRLSENIKIIVNPHPEMGRFSSIKIGLKSLMIKNNVFIHNIDNPFVEVGLLKLLFNDIQQAGYCVPVYKNRGGHPILISPKVGDAIIKCSHNDLNLKEYLKAFQKKTIEINDPKIMININTIQEYKEIFPGFKV
jgi:CTP:molybdopterin cytidylyltransferase MocA